MVLSACNSFSNLKAMKFERWAITPARKCLFRQFDTLHLQQLCDLQRQQHLLQLHRGLLHTFQQPLYKLFVRDHRGIARLVRAQAQNDF